MFTKFLLTVAVVAVIWFGIRYAQRLGGRRNRQPRNPAEPGTRFTPDMDGESVRDLVKCPICNTWRPAGSASCGRAECPH